LFHCNLQFCANKHFTDGKTVFATNSDNRHKGGSKRKNIQHLELLLCVKHS